MKVSEDEDGELQGCYEQMSCSDLQKVTAIFAKLSAWREECIINNCSAEEVITHPTRSSRDCTRLVITWNPQMQKTLIIVLLSGFCMLGLNLLL